MQLAPLWVVLTLSGTLLLVVALTLERRLRRAEGALAGFTADPLFSDERRRAALEAVPVVAAFTPSPVAPAEKGLAQDGGRFGGGASERF